MTQARSPQRRKLSLLLLAASALAVLVLVVALTLSLISWQGRREWEKTKADLLARGEKLSLAEFVPAPIPDDRNFFGDPMWKELSDTVDQPGDAGIVVREPRLPKGQRQIDAIDPVLPAATLARLKAAFPKGITPPASATTGLALIANVRADLIKTDDPAAAAALAPVILDALAPGLPAQRHIESLLDRPGAIFIRDYSTPLLLNASHTFYFLRIAQTAQARAMAHLALGESAEATREIIFQLRLAHTLDNDPLLIEFLVQRAVVTLALTAINRGITWHRLSEMDLAAIESLLATTNDRDIFVKALRADRGYSNDGTEALRHDPQRAKAFLEQSMAMQETFFQGPALSALEKNIVRQTARLFTDEDQANYNRLIQQRIDELSRPGGIRPVAIPRYEDKGRLYRVIHFQTVASSEIISRLTVVALASQDAVFMTRIACALERYRLKNGDYPESLDALIPAFIEKIPACTLAEQQFHYRRENNGKFRLWSPGWNETDEGGVTAKSHGAYDQGDWVWNEQPGPGR